MNMKAFSKEKDRFALTEKAVFYLLIILAIAGMTAPILFGDYNLSLLGSYLGIPMILAPIIWYKVKKNPDKTINGKPELGYICSILFFVCYSASILVLYFYPVRSIEYYLLVTIMGMCILGQILFAGEVSSKARTAILIQTILLMLNIIWGVNLKYYFFIGRTDIIHHSWLAKNLMNTGHISEAFEIYAAFPLWHILCSVITQICGLSYPPHTVMFLINGVVYSFLVIIVYLAVNKIVKNEKIALLSALFLCLNPDALFYGMYSIPRSAVFFLEMLLIYLLLQKKDTITVAVTIFSASAIVMYHPASIPFVLLILVLVYFLQRFYKIERETYLVTLNYLFLVVVMTLTYWLYYGQAMFRAIIKNLLTEGPSGVLTKSIFDSPLNELFNYLQFSPLLFFIICGVLYI
jgi:hypothetical protein